MEIQAGPLDWTSVDEENLAKFLETETGKRFLPKLLETTPSLLPHGEINAILIRTGEVRGYSEVARSILVLAHPAPKNEQEHVTEYPPLDDPRHWKDVDKAPEIQ